VAAASGLNRGLGRNARDAIALGRRMTSKREIFGVEAGGRSWRSVAWRRREDQVDRTFGVKRERAAWA
jgi:hypothetical protein